MKAKKILSKAARTAYDVAKLGFQLESGDIPGINKTILDAAQTWGGKNNMLARAEGKLDAKLSKNRFYRVGKAATSAYYDARKGNFTGVYDDSIQVAKQVLGKKHSSAIRSIDEKIQKYVMPTAQTVQDAYQFQKAVRGAPQVAKSAYNAPSVRNVAKAGFRAAYIADKSKKIATTAYKI